ncbi:MAG: response regulator [Anaerolineae bacterium]
MAKVTREQVHEALTCLNDNMQLARSLLATQFPEVRSAVTVTARANALRAILLQAIEVLRPPRHLPFGSLASRSYDVLSLRYVGSKSISEVCQEFGLGRRQIHRDLTQAEEKLTEILNERPGLDVLPGGTESALGEELLVLPTESVRARLQEVIQATVMLLKPLAEQFQVRLAFAPADSRTTLVHTDLAMLKQVLVQLLSAAVQATTSREVLVGVEEEGERATVAIRFVANASRLNMGRLMDVQRIASSQRMSCQLNLEPPERAEMLLQLSRATPTRVLVVEDNASAIELYRRYLPPGEWEVHSVADPRFAWDVAKSLAPQVIILDIMLPKMDGWSVLGLLAGRPETARIPVVICSVVEDPGLAKALGARACLKKPISRADLLTVLNQCLTPLPPSR